MGTLPFTGHPAPGGACSLSSLPDEMRTVPRWVVGWRGDWSCCYRGIPQSAPEGLFLLGKNPRARSCGSLCTRKGLTSHTAPLSSLAGGCLGQDHMRPNFQLSLASACGLPGFSTSSLFPSLQVQATGSLTVLLSPCLAGQWALNRAVSQESCSRPCTGGPGAAASLIPALVPGTFFS